MTLYAMPNPSSMFFPPSITCKTYKTGFYPHILTPKGEYVLVMLVIIINSRIRKHLTLQATSIFIGFPPNSVGGE